MEELQLCNSIAWVTLKYKSERKFSHLAGFRIVLFIFHFAWKDSLIHVSTLAYRHGNGLASCQKFGRNTVRKLIARMPGDEIVISLNEHGV